MTCHPGATGWRVADLAVTEEEGGGACPFERVARRHGTAIDAYTAEELTAEHA